MRRAHALRERLGDARRLAAALPEGEAAVLGAVERLARSHRALAPLALTVGGFAMLFDGLRLLFANWRLIVIQVLPATVVWLAMYDLRARVLRRTATYHPNPALVLFVGAAIVALTAIGFFLNAVFAFAISARPPEIAYGFGEARAHARPVLAWGAGIGLALAVTVLAGANWPRPWGTLALGVVVALLMICYVAVPARVVGVRKGYKLQEKWTVSLVGSTVGVMVEAPAYIVGRIGILLLGSKALLPLGVILIAVGIVMQASATGAVRAVKLGSVLLASRPADAAGGAKLEG